MNYHLFHGLFIFGLNKTDLNDLFGGGNILMKWGENSKSQCQAQKKCSLWFCGGCF